MVWKKKGASSTTITMAKKYSFESLPNLYIMKSEETISNFMALLFLQKNGSAAAGTESQNTEVRVWGSQNQFFHGGLRP